MRRRTVNSAVIDNVALYVFVQDLARPILAPIVKEDKLADTLQPMKGYPLVKEPSFISNKSDYDNRWMMGRTRGDGVPGFRVTIVIACQERLCQHSIDLTVNTNGLVTESGFGDVYLLICKLNF
jgi:hypothetical protein